MSWTCVNCSVLPAGLGILKKNRVFIILEVKLIAGNTNNIFSNIRMDPAVDTLFKCCTVL